MEQKSIDETVEKKAMVLGNTEEADRLERELLNLGYKVDRRRSTIYCGSEDIVINGHIYSNNPNDGKNDASNAVASLK